MSILELNGTDFRILAGQILAGGHRVRFIAAGASMRPFIQDGDILEVAPLSRNRIHLGDVLLVVTGGGRVLAHRVVKIRQQAGNSIFLIKGDSSASTDGWFEIKNILGRVEILEHAGLVLNLTSVAQRWRAWIWITGNPWIGNFSWLPPRFRRLVKRWLLID